MSNRITQFITTTSLLLILALPAAAPAKTIEYQSPQAFIDEVFTGQSPQPKILWLNGELRERIEQIVEHSYPRARIRYYQKAARSLWILDEIGKERDITAGIVIGPQGIEQLKILIFRESRGYEISNAFFTRQFNQAGLDEHLELNHPIDNISGATLSVRASKKMARLALFLHQYIYAQEIE